MFYLCPYVWTKRYDIYAVTAPAAAPSAASAPKAPLPGPGAAQVGDCMLIVYKTGKYYISCIMVNLLRFFWFARFPQLDQTKKLQYCIFTKHLDNYMVFEA